MLRRTSLTPPPAAGVANGARPPAAPSARSLLLTILGEYVLPGGGKVWTGAVLDALALLQVGPATARQALARSAEAGLLTAERIGRETQWELTERAALLLSEGTERIYQFGRHRVAWDGQWLLVMVTVPEPSRHVRHQLRVRLGWAGFAPLAPGTWISPWVERQAEAVSLLAALGLAGASTVFLSRLGGGEDPQAVASQAWELARLQADYRQFIARQSAVDPVQDSASFAALTMLVHEWRHFPAADPDLPAELLPPSWPGHDAAGLFHDRHAIWAPAARGWWAGHT